MLTPRFSATAAEEPSINTNTGKDCIFSPSKLELFLDTTITGISLLIAFGVYIYLFAIAAMVCLARTEYAASLAITSSYDVNGTTANNNNDTAAAVPLITLIFPRSNSPFLRGAAPADGSITSATTSDDSPATTLHGHSGDSQNNDIVENSNFIPSQQLRNAVYSWLTDQDHHQAWGKYGHAVIFFDNDHSYKSESIVGHRGDTTSNDKDDMDSNHGNYHHTDGNDGRVSGPIYLE
jgi:hypothetical protein